MNLKRILDCVWNNLDAPSARYVPRAVTPPLPDWQVWDRKDQRFLSDREARKIDPNERMALQ